MPDRSLRLLTLPPQPTQGGTRGAVLLRERPAPPPEAPPGREDGRRDDAPREDNPFAPPPEGAPDQPWRPRRPAGGGNGGPQDPGDGSPGAGGPSPWSNRWSDRQPGRSPGGFGELPRRPEPPAGGGPGTGLRWDPTDPAQRRAHYALLAGMWAFFLVLFGWTYVSLLLGALALYWGGSSLRAKPRTPAPSPDAPAPAPPQRPQTTAAVSGLVTASLALLLVGVTFVAQLVYRDYYTCVRDAPTNEAKQSCSRYLPEELRGFLRVES
jgi:hypothetical protein